LLFGGNVEVFQFEDYKRCIKSTLKLRGVSVKNVSKNCNMRASHLSRVLNTEHHITMDQAFNLTQEFGYNEDETQFFLNLVEIGRSGDLSYIEFLKKKNSVIAKKSDDLSKRLNKKNVTLNELGQQIFYSSWIYLAVNIITSIEAYQTPAAISEKLSLPIGTVTDVLSFLEKNNLVKKQGHRFLFHGTSSHLSRNSSLINSLHSSWRLKAISKVNETHLNSNAKGNNLHFSIVQAIDEKSFISLKKEFLTIIKVYSERADKAKSEELICFNLDFFRL
jgi:transcriptional regulator with XRE-family HTH domain